MNFLLSILFFLCQNSNPPLPGLGTSKSEPKDSGRVTKFFVYLFIFLLFSLFHLRMMEATVFLGTFNAAYFLVPFPRSVPRHNPVSELYGQFLRPHGLVFAVTCTVNCETLFRQVCAFPNHVQSIEFTTGELQVVETFQRWSMETGCTWALTYVNKVFLFCKHLQTFLRTCFCFVIMGYCDVIMGYCDVIMLYCV
jgi:hypothetical protein